MIDVALVRLVGSGLALLAEGYGEAVPSGAVERGYHLVGFLAKEGGELDMNGFVAGIVGDIWQRWSEARLPPGIALAHIDALPAMMDRHRPQDGFLTSMIVSALTTARHGQPPTDQPMRVAEAIIGRARTAGALGGQDLSEQILHFFLERLMSRLFADLAAVAQMRPLLQRYLIEDRWRQEAPTRSSHAASVATASEPPAQARSSCDRPAPDAETVAIGLAGAAQAAPANETPPHPDPVMAEITQVAEAHGVPALALAALLKRRGAAVPPGTVAAAAADCAEGLMRLLADFAAAEPALLPSALELAAQFRAEIAVGAFEEASHILGAIEELQVRAAQTDLPAAQTLLGAAANMRAARADIDILHGAWRRAARHLGSAVRCLDQGDRLGRWRLLMRQGEALVQAHREHAEHAALLDAVQVYGSAASLLSEQSAQFECATTNLCLGNLLMALAEQENRPDRLRAAALHFKPAVDMFSQLKAADEWARAQLGLARALQAQGMVQGDIVTLGEAAFACRAALGVVTPDRMPEEWTAALQTLAATQIRIAEETGEPAGYAEAATAFRKLLSAPSGAGKVYDPVDVKLRLGDALLAEASLTKDELPLQEAAQLYRDMLEPTLAVTSRAEAYAANALGTALWALGDRANDVALLSDAARAKLGALDFYEAVGTDTESEASRVRADLVALEQAIDDCSKSAAPPRSEAAE